MMLDDGTGIVRRKKVRRTTAERAGIVAESYAAGATVSGVAQRYGIASSQLSSWRSAARARAQTSFAAIEIAPDLVPSARSNPDSIEVVVGVVVIRLPKSSTPKRIADIAHHLARGT
jgi:hypothetical protein